MITAIRTAYGAGYRAGLGGSHFTVNRFRGSLIPHILWDLGWKKGNRLFLERNI
jgi:hypothetical protein